MADYYTVKLLGIKCLAAQELDGDEVCIRFNGSVVWQSGSWKMHERPSKPDTFNEIDFVKGQGRNRDGWVGMSNFNAANFIFGGIQGISRFEIWEEDRRRATDHLGAAPVSVYDAGHGKISIVFNRVGANYMLTYEVVV